MTRQTATTVVLEVDSVEQEELLRQFHAFVLELGRLAVQAPDGHVLEQCEAVAWTRGQQLNSQVLQKAVQQRIEAAEKKGRRCGAVPAAPVGKIAAPVAARC